jgi:hypothetical protein
LINPNDQLERLRIWTPSSGDRICRYVWRRKVEQGSHGIEDLVDHFAFALKRGRLT